MNILLVPSSYLPNLGGLQSVTSNLASELRQRGHSVTVLTNRYPRTLATQEQINDVPVRRLLFQTPRIEYLKNGRMDLFIAGIFYFPLSLIRLIWYVLDVKPDVVNLHYVGAPSLFIWVAHAVLRFRLVVSLHGNDVEGLPRESRLNHWVFQKILYAADEITACSKYLLNRALAMMPDVERRARVVYNGIRMDEAASQHMVYVPQSFEDGFIVSVGRLVRVKAFDVLLRAIKECRRQGITVRVILIGDGVERAALEQLAAELDLAAEVTFLGTQPHTTVMDMIKTSRFVVIPSREESFSLTALEAMSCCKAVVATQCGGIPEVVRNNETGIIVPPEDPRALSQAIVALWENPAEAETLGRRGYTVASREFSIERQAEQYLKAFTKAVQLDYVLGQ